MSEKYHDNCSTIHRNPTIYLIIKNDNNNNNKKNLNICTRIFILYINYFLNFLICHENE